MRQSTSQTKIAARYLEAKTAVIEEGFGPEIDWQNNLSFDEIGESDFLREGAWVILSSGMRESVIREKFTKISKAFVDWKSANAIVRQKADCRRQALSVFGHRGKIDAIIELAERVYVAGFGAIWSRLAAEGVPYLQTFRYMGPATARHFAKNLGLDVVKPDRHLLRVSRATGFESPAALCDMIAKAVGDKKSVVDIVIWRFATLRENYLEHFGQS